MTWLLRPVNSHDTRCRPSAKRRMSQRVAGRAMTKRATMRTNAQAAPTAASPHKISSGRWATLWMIGLLPSRSSISSSASAWRANMSIPSVCRDRPCAGPRHLVKRPRHRPSAVILELFVPTRSKTERHAQSKRAASHSSPVITGSTTLLSSRISGAPLHTGARSRLAGARGLGTDLQRTPPSLRTAFCRASLLIANPIARSHLGSSPCTIRSSPSS